MARVVMPPEPYHHDPAMASLFLAGSIAMGQAADWQAELIAALADLPISILNPRRLH